MFMTLLLMLNYNNYMFHRTNYRLLTMIMFYHSLVNMDYC